MARNCSKSEAGGTLNFLDCNPTGECLVGAILDTSLLQLGKLRHGETGLPAHRRSVVSGRVRIQTSDGICTFITTLKNVLK